MALWADVLGLAFLVALNPLLLALILVILTRPRPVANLFGYWVGCLLVNVPLWVGALLALHLVPSFESFALALAAPDPNSGIQPMKLGMGVFALVIATVMVARRRVRQRQKEPALVGAAGAGSPPGSDGDAPAESAPEPGRGVKGVIAGVIATIQRLLARAQEAWDGGAVWVSVLFGLGYIAPLSLVLVVNTMIVGSGVALGTQILAVLAFVVVMLGVLEFVLCSSLLAPNKTQAVLQPVHTWAEAHRTHILVTLFVVVGIWQLITGAGLL